MDSLPITAFDPLILVVLAIPFAILLGVGLLFEQVFGDPHERYGRGSESSGGAAELLEPFAMVVFTIVRVIFATVFMVACSIPFLGPRLAKFHKNIMESRMKKEAERDKLERKLKDLSSGSNSVKDYSPSTW